jgi:hypothetical protein
MASTSSGIDVLLRSENVSGISSSLVGGGRVVTASSRCGNGRFRGPDQADSARQDRTIEEALPVVPISLPSASDIHVGSDEGSSLGTRRNLEELSNRASSR